MNDQDNDNSLAPEILAFMHRVFSGCTINSKYYPEHQAWRFQLSFTTDHTRFYHICPPKGCCLMKVHQLGREVTFEITLFVDQFISYHLQPIQN